MKNLKKYNQARREKYHTDLEWRKKEDQRQAKANKNRNKEKSSIRSKTHYRYGKPPKGMEYHHPTPYHPDIWILMYEEEHQALPTKSGLVTAAHR